MDGVFGVDGGCEGQGGSGGRKDNIVCFDKVISNVIKNLRRIRTFYTQCTVRINPVPRFLKHTQRPWSR